MVLKSTLAARRSNTHHLLQRSLTAAAARPSSLSSFASIFSAQNLVIFVGLLTLGGSAFKSLKDYLTSWLMTKYFVSKTIRAGSENKTILETYIKSICRDEFGLIRIRGEDEISKVTEAQKKEEDVLAYDKDKFDIKVSHLPPIVSKFVHSTAEATFFRVIDPKDAATQPTTTTTTFTHRLSQYILVVRSEDSILNLFIPLMLRNALHDLWKKTFRRWIIQTLSMETYTNLLNLFGGGNSKQERDTSKITLYALRSSAKRLRLFFQEAERFHRESKTKALYIRDMMYGQNFKAQPRPMSTIAVEPGSGLDRLKEDVAIFWTQRKKLEKNDLPFQRVHLLHGPPGNGKSSILQALAIQYEIPYFYLDANAVGTADMLRALLTRYTTSERCLVVIEDAESAMPKPERYIESGSSSSHGAGAGASGNGSADTGGGSSSSSTGKESGEGEEEEDDTSEKISVKEFVEMINGSQSPRPAGRLICLTTNTLDALPAEVLRLVNSQGNMFEFPNAGKATMKGYWKNFFQSDNYWEVFSIHYTSLWGQELDESNNRPKRLHSAADLQKYCMRFRGRPQEACLHANVQTFAPSKSSSSNNRTGKVGLAVAATTVAATAVAVSATSSTSATFSSPQRGYPFTTNTTNTTHTTTATNNTTTATSILTTPMALPSITPPSITPPLPLPPPSPTPLPLPLLRQGSHTFSQTHNIPHSEATKWLDDNNREWTRASKGKFTIFNFSICSTHGAPLLKYIEIY